MNILIPYVPIYDPDLSPYDRAVVYGLLAFYLDKIGPDDDTWCECPIIDMVIN